MNLHLEPPSACPSHSQPTTTFVSIHPTPVLLNSVSIFWLNSPALDQHLALPATCSSSPKFLPSSSPCLTHFLLPWSCSSVCSSCLCVLQTAVHLAQTTSPADRSFNDRMSISSSNFYPELQTPVSLPLPGHFHLIPQKFCKKQMFKQNVSSFPYLPISLFESHLMAPLLYPPLPPYVH